MSTWISRPGGMGNTPEKRSPCPVHSHSTLGRTGRRKGGVRCSLKWRPPCVWSLIFEEESNGKEKLCDPLQLRWAPVRKRVSRWGHERGGEVAARLHCVKGSRASLHIGGTRLCIAPLPTAYGPRPRAPAKSKIRVSCSLPLWLLVLGLGRCSLGLPLCTVAHGPFLDINHMT